MSPKHSSEQGGRSFRRPASYGRPAYDDGDGHEGVAETGGADGTRPFSQQELAEASGAPAEAQASDAGPGAGRVDQTLVSPIARERIRAEVNVPDPAYPPQQPQRRSQRGETYADRYEYRPSADQRYQQVPQRPLRRRQAPPQARQPVPSPPGYAYEPSESPVVEAAHRHGHGIARGVLLFLSWCFRLAAWGLVALVIVNSFTVGNRVTLMRITERATQMLPDSLAGLYVVDTPFGGAFRGDFAIAAVVLFVLDWIMARIRRRLR